MRVRATKDIQAYYKLTEGEEYKVHGIIHFVTPYMNTSDPRTIDEMTPRNFVTPLYSYGVIRNETVYIIESIIQTGRRTFARFNTSNFEVVDSTVPDDWTTTVIDLHDEVKAIRDALAGAEEDTEQMDKILDELKKFNAKIVSVGGVDFRSPERLYAICDDNSDDE